MVRRKADAWEKRVDGREVSELLDVDNRQRAKTKCELPAVFYLGLSRLLLSASFEPFPAVYGHLEITSAAPKSESRRDEAWHGKYRSIRRGKKAGSITPVGPRHALAFRPSPVSTWDPAASALDFLICFPSVRCNLTSKMSLKAHCRKRITHK